VLFDERPGAVHEHHQFHDAFDLVQIADSGMKRTQEIDGHSTSDCFALCGSERRPKLADPGLTVDLGDAARKKASYHCVEKARKPRPAALVPGA
jgi:hypothetical protein